MPSWQYSFFSTILKWIGVLLIIFYRSNIITLAAAVQLGFQAPVKEGRNEVYVESFFSFVPCGHIGNEAPGIQFNFRGNVTGMTAAVQLDIAVTV